MPWYRFYCTHGPGHQGKDETYKYYDGFGKDATEEWIKELLEEDWQEWCRVEWFENAIGSQELVEELPEQERRNQILKYRRRAKAALDMLMILGADMEEP